MSESPAVAPSPQPGSRDPTDPRERVEARVRGVRRLLPSRATVAYVAYLLGFALVAGYVLHLGQRSLAAYAGLKEGRSRLRRRIYGFDPRLGYVPLPGSLAFDSLPGRAPIAMRHGLEGFRVPLGHAFSPLGQRPWVLALGCSFTYGDACVAEEAYPYLVARDLGGSALNAGCNSYGLSQMLLLARDLIPRYQPDYVLVQSSPWLAPRGSSGFARSTFGKVPVPYFTVSVAGKVEIQPPLFRSWLYDLRFERFVSERRGAREFLALFFEAGAPLFLHDDFEMIRFHLRSWSGAIVAPLPQATRRAAAARVNRAAYEEIASICRRAGARLVIVDLRHHLEKHLAEPHGLARMGLVVRAQAALDALVPEESEEAYYRRFGHWGDTPPRLVDTHPNAEAHRVIAGSILRAIRRRAPAARPGPAAEVLPRPRPGVSTRSWPGAEIDAWAWN